MKWLTICLLGIATSALGQSYSQILGTIEKGNLDALERLMGMRTDTTISIQVSEERTLVLANDYQLYHLSNWGNSTDDTIYNLTVLTKGPTIIYALVSYNTLPDRCLQVSDINCKSTIECTWQNKGLYPYFLVAYQKYYHRPFNIDYISGDTGNIYGYKCGFTGQDPPLRTALDYYLSINSTTPLNEWLYSGEPAKEAYAVEGFFKLQAVGTFPSPAQLVQINSIKNMDAWVTTCGGCLTNTANLRNVLEPYVFPAIPCEQ